MKKFTILIAAIVLVCFAAPAMAVDWNFYGNARMATFWSSRDFEDTTSGGVTEDSELDWNFQGNSRIGANVKADHIRARVEMGLNADPSDGGDGSVTVRHAWGRWNFGAGYFQIGKSYTPVSQFVSGQVGRRDAGLIGFGAPYGGRPGNAALSFGGFDIALITPKTSEALVTEGGTTLSGDEDPIIPKIEASWGMSRDTWNFKIFGGYQYYSIEDVVSLVDGSTNDIDVTSYIIGGSGGVNFGAFYINAQLHFGQNYDNARWASGPEGDTAAAGWDGDDDTNDVNSWGGVLVAGFKMSDMLTFEGGFGYAQDDPDDADINDEKTKAWDAYVQAVIQMAPGVFVIPEIGFAEYGNTPADLDQGKDWYAGAKWQINF